MPIDGNPEMKSPTADNLAGATPFDMPSLVARCLGDERFAEEMLRLFSQQAPELVAKLDAALASGNALSVADAAHAIKGSAGSASAIHVAAVAAKVEDDAKAGRHPAHADVRRLRDEVARCDRYVESTNERS